MQSSQSIIDIIETLMRNVSQAKRKDLQPELQRLSELLGRSPNTLDYLMHNVANWPSSRGRQATEIRYHVDFSHGERPDHRLYGATFEEVRALLRYTPASCKVAFGTGGGKVDRTKRSTRLGPCIITKLPEAVNAADYPQMLRLKDKEDERRASNFPGAKARKLRSVSGKY